MFTGIIQEIGKLKKKISTPEGMKLTIQCSRSFSDQLKTGDSVSIDGVCQTVVSFKNNEFTVDCVRTSLEKTTLGKYEVNTEVNLELALRPLDRLGGHIVQGHVNGTARIIQVKSYGNSYLIRFDLNKKYLKKYIVQEGSVTINGISLTVSNKEEDGIFDISVIPHTFNHTNLKNKKIDQEVNIEVDILIKYVESLLSPINGVTKYDQTPSTQSNINLEWLLKKGY